MVKKYNFVLLNVILLSLLMPFCVTYAAGTTIQVAPLASTVNGGTTFTINLTVTDVTDLAVWEFRLFYLNTILTCTNAVQGPFLEKGGGTQFFTFTIYNAYNATHGCLLLGASLIGPVPGVSGSGTLANITFQAIGAGDTQLQFDNDPTWNFLKDSTPPPRHPIPYTTIDGTVHVTAAHNIAVTNVTSPKKVIFRSFFGNITTTIANTGSYSENVNVTVYANMTSTSNATIIGVFKNVTLNNGTSANLTLTWNTTTFVKGNYTLIASADPVPGETNTADNNYTGGWVTVSIPGDVTGGTGNPWDFVPDGKVDGKDIAIVALCFGSAPGSPPPYTWNANCDVNNDAKVDGKDIATVALHFGQAGP